MCPPTLIDNWVDEFHKWLPINADMKELDPQYIGRIHRADGEQTPPQRARAIHDWDENGGILIMSYQVFRQTVASYLGKILLEGYFQLHYWTGISCLQISRPERHRRR
jgi:SNF2 family DNA or RNA helicase